MPIGFDHIVIAVDNLDQTINDYTSAGFTVTPGGDHQHGGSHNALVTFADGSYFELIAFKNNDASSGHRWRELLAKGEGLVDYALRTNDLDQEWRDLRAAGLNVDELKDGGRFRPDGQRVDWRILRFLENRTTALPFYCHDKTDRGLRVPGGEAAQHANGATQVRGVTIVVNNLANATEDYAAVTGSTAEAVESTLEGAASASRLAISDVWIELVQPAEGDNELSRYLASRGERPYEISVATPNGDGALLSTEQTHGARIRLTQ